MLQPEKMVEDEQPWLFRFSKALGAPRRRCRRPLPRRRRALLPKVAGFLLVLGGAVVCPERLGRRGPARRRAEAGAAAPDGGATSSAPVLRQRGLEVVGCTVRGGSGFSLPDLAWATVADLGQRAWIRSGARRAVGGDTRSPCQGGVPCSVRPLLVLAPVVLMVPSWTVSCC
jgi:hypothetical protein